MVSVSVDVTEYPAIVLPEKTKVNEYQIVFHDHRSVVYIHLFTDDAKASGFASHLIDVSTALRVRTRLATFHHTTGVSLHDTPVANAGPAGLPCSAPKAHAGDIQVTGEPPPFVTNGFGFESTKSILADVHEYIRLSPDEMQFHGRKSPPIWIPGSSTKSSWKSCPIRAQSPL